MDYTSDILNILFEIASNGGPLRLEPGLSERELERAEEIYGFRFPPDWRSVLALALPLDGPDSDWQRFPNWREVPNEYIQGYMDWPLERLLFDTQYRRLPGWPKEPQEGEDKEAMTRATLDAAPILIPLYGHRFLPATPCESGNPVFSMFGTDTIIYGADLLRYFCFEFHVTDPRPQRPTLKKIPFWSQLAGDE